jgi:hypothetical protein
MLSKTFQEDGLNERKPNPKYNCLYVLNQKKLCDINKRFQALTGEDDVI